MSDIVERLRVLLPCRCEPDAACCERCSIADAIEEEFESLRARLTETLGEYDKLREDIQDRERTIAELQDKVAAADVLLLDIRADADEGIVDAIDSWRTPTVQPQCKCDLRTKLVECENQLAKAERDAARYRWLRATCESNNEVCPCCGYDGLDLVSGETLDNYIDAAMAPAASASACTHWWTVSPNPTDVECKVCGVTKADQPGAVK